MIGLSLIILTAGLGQTVRGQTFIHPGLLHTAADFTRMQANYLNDPWVGSWNRLVSNPRSQTTWNPRPLQTVIRGGTGQNYAQFFPDIAAAYQSALRYKITGDTAYANQSIRIMNAWSSTMTNLTGDADRFLAAGIYGYEFCQAAEMMRGYSGWAASDFTAFKNLMLNVFYPLQHDFLVNHNGACIDNYWANWDLCNIAGMAAIGVLCDDRTKYNEALNYFKTGAGQGSINRSIPFLYSGTPTLGQGEESGRDQGHSGLDVSLWGVVCQQFYNQGDDMFAYNGNRVLAACEYFAQYNINTNNTVPFTTFNWGSGTTCAANSQTVISSNSRGDQRPCWDLIYNHYQVLKGLYAPNSAAYAALLRPDGGGGDYGTTSGGFDQLGYTTLTATLSTGPIANGTYSLKNVADGKMLDNLGVATNGAPASQWTDGTSNNQKWIVTLVSGSTYTLQCVTGSLMLDSLGHSGNGSTVGQWAGSGSHNQQWIITIAGGHYKITNVANGLCLDTGGLTGNGSTMQMWGSGGSNNQLWDFVAP